MLYKKSGSFPFLDNPNNYRGIGFKDNNRHNCSADNLYYYQRLSDIKKSSEKFAEYNKRIAEEQEKIKAEYKAKMAEAKERFIQEKKEERAKEAENREKINK